MIFALQYTKNIISNLQLTHSYPLPVYLRVSNKSFIFLNFILQHLNNIAQNTI